MSVDPQRIVALFADARQRFGEAVFRDPRRLVPMLSDQAPDMRGAIKATAAALSAGAVDRLLRSPDRGAEMQRIAQEIAGSDGLNPHDAMVGVHVAGQLGAMFAPPGQATGDAARAPVMPAMPAPRAPSGQTEWVGVSSAVGTPGAQPASPPAPPPTPPAAQPYAQQPFPSLPPAPAASNSSAVKWIIGVVAVIGAITAYHVGRGGGDDEPPPRPQPPPQQQPGPQAGPGQPPQQRPPQGQPPQGQPPQGQPPQGQPPQGGNLPMIAAPDSGQMPALRPTDGGQAWVFVFLAPTGQQPLRVMVGVSKQGWGAGLIAVATLQANEPESISTPSPFQLNRQGNDVFRVLQPQQWQRDGLNVGGACVVFAASGGQDVSLQNSKLCVLSDNCQRIVGCGVVQ